MKEPTHWTLRKIAVIKEWMKKCIPKIYGVVITYADHSVHISLYFPHRIAYIRYWISRVTQWFCNQLHQPRLWFITGGYLVKRWFPPAAARARWQSNDLNREILASNLFNCHKEVINAPPVPSISICIHIVYRHKNVWEYQWSNFIYNCTSTFVQYVRCRDALLNCSAPGGERCESLTRVDEIASI